MGGVILYLTRRVAAAATMNRRIGMDTARTVTLSKVSFSIAFMLPNA
jgi:hypothetical protein